MQMTENTKTKPVFEQIKTDMLDLLAEETEKRGTAATPKPKPVVKRWPRLLVW